MKTHKCSKKWSIFKIGFLVFFAVALTLPISAVSTTSGQKSNKNSKIQASDDIISPILDAPANLTAIVVTSDEIQNKAMNVSVQFFRSSWQITYESIHELPLLIIDLTQPNGGLNSSEIAMLNGSLLIGTARDLIGYQWPLANDSNSIVQTPWYNSSYGSGWAIYAGSLPITFRAVSFYATTLTRYDGWSGVQSYEQRFTYLIGSYPTGIGEGSGPNLPLTLSNFENYLISITKRSYTGLTLYTRFENICNITLPGYSEPNHTAVYNENIQMLKDFIDLAAQYDLKLYLYTDELSLTTAQYNWLMANLNYTGPAFKSDYPAHLSGAAPGVWELLDAKYNAVVASLKTILNANNSAGFGGFYFRIDDLSNDYPYSYGLLTPVPYLSRFINLTTAAAAQLNASVIQRMWIKGDTPNPFNNATVAEELLDPIQATNLILRTKETCNDHWYDHPPNPTIGMSQHPWIIAWYTGAAMPDYRGSYFDQFYNVTNWINNPNVQGYDLPSVAAVSFTRLDQNPFVAANNYYLYMKMFYGNINGNQSLERYFHEVGINDNAVIANLTEVFNDVHMAFRLLSFWQAWAATGTFTGDVLNGGNSMLFNPGRFNMFFQAILTTNYSLEYTIQEAYRGLAYAELAFSEFPDSIDGNMLPALTNGYLDPEYASDPSNMTQELETLRGNVRQFVDFAEIFAPYRAWHITFYAWGYFGNVSDWIRSNQYRDDIMNAYNNYISIWGNNNYWYQIDFRDFTHYWLPTEGQLNAIRMYLTLLGLLIALGIVLFVITYRTKQKAISKPLARLLFGKLVSNQKIKDKNGNSRNSEDIGEIKAINIDGNKDGDKIENINRNKTENNDENLVNLKDRGQVMKPMDIDMRKHWWRFVIGVVILPAILVAFYSLVLIAATNNFIPDLGLLLFYLIGSFVLAILVTNFLMGIKKGGTIRQAAKNLYPTGLIFLPSMIFIIPTLVMFIMGGPFIVTASQFMLYILLGTFIASLVYGFILQLKNQTQPSIIKLIFYGPLVILITLGIFFLVTFPYGGPAGLVNLALQSIGSL